MTILRGLLFLAFCSSWVLFIAVFISCGLDPKGDDGPDIIIQQPEPPEPLPPTPPAPGNTDPTWTGDVQNIAREQCALAGCHAGTKWFNSAAAFKASKAEQVISNGRMPPTYSPNYDIWSEKKKARMLEFLGN